MKYNRRMSLKRQIKTVFKKDKMVFIYFTIYTITAGLFPVIGIVFPRLIINGIIEGKNFNTLFGIIGLMGGLLIVFGVVSEYLKQLKDVNFLAIRISEFNNMADYYLKAKYENVENPVWIDKTEKSMRTLDNDGSGYQGTLSNIFLMFAMILSIAIYVYLVTVFNAWILLAIAVGMLISILCNKFAKDISYKNQDKINRQYRRYSYYINTTSDFSCAKDIRVYGLKRKILGSFKKETLSYIKILNYIKNRQYLLGVLELFAVLIKEGIAYYLLIKAVVNSQIGLGDFTMYVAAIAAISQTLNAVAKIVSDSYEWLGYTMDYYNLLESYTDDEVNGVLPSDTDTFKIEFKNVSFKYPNTEQYILKNFNFTIEKGTKLAIVGVNGAGKSTIVKLITGLFEPTEGEILINGMKIIELNKIQYYKQFSVVFQDVNIYSFSVRENVSMKNASDTDDGLVIECLESVGLWDKIKELPHGLDTNMLKIIDEEGIELSGGQNQKLAIARALYQGGKCVILDEPTAALDALAEAEIYRGFNHLVDNKTAIYISHRLASTKFCDKIALFSKDGLEEYGNHNELIEKKGLYYEMFVTQGKYYQKEEAK